MFLSLQITVVVSHPMAVLQSMAQITRNAKSGSNWTINDLEAYNIVVQEQNENAFFGGSLPNYNGPADFLHYEHRAYGLDPASTSLLKRLDMAVHVMDGEESAVGDFTAELLRILGYETDETVIRTCKSLNMLMCSEDVSTKADVCLLDEKFLVLLVVQEDKNHISPMDPEAQLIAEAIAAFQENNNRRGQWLYLNPLQVQIIPGITMIGTFPTFYKITVTSELSACVEQGQYPATQTVVRRHTPCVPKRKSGMGPLFNRELLVRCYEAFKYIVLSGVNVNEEYRSVFATGRGE